MKRQVDGDYIRHVLFAAIREVLFKYLLRPAAPPDQRRSFEWDINVPMMVCMGECRGATVT